MRNLATACQTYGMASGYYPGAGSYELFGIDESDGIRNAKKFYYDRPGWISWNSEGAYESRPQSHAASMSWFTSCYEQNDTVLTAYPAPVGQQIRNGYGQLFS
jgi:hypothetical protein